MNYREKQRDFEARAKAVTVICHSGFDKSNLGRNVAKRAFKALCAAAKGKEGGWKKRIRLLLIRAKQEGHKL